METICIDKQDHQDHPDYPGNPDHLDHLHNLDSLHHLDHSDQSNHFDNPDWPMINQEDNCRIRIVYLVLFKDINYSIVLYMRSSKLIIKMVAHRYMMIIFYFSTYNFKI